MSSTFKINFAKNIKFIRNNLNLSQQAVAKKVGIGKGTLNGYEYQAKIPSYSKLISLSDGLGISISTLLLLEKSNYIKNITLLKLAEKIDKLQHNERYQIESTAVSLLKNENKVNRPTIMDDDFQLTNNFQHNIRVIRERKKYTQKQMAEKLHLTVRQYNSYEGKIEPSFSTLLNISRMFKTSIHSLVTGEKLSFKFDNKNLLENILKVDEEMNFKSYDILIHLMTVILNKNKIN